MPNWGEMFHLSTPVLETFIRGTLMFLVIYGLMRVAGKREAGAHSLTDLLVVVLVAEASAHGMAGQARGIFDSLVLVATILGWSVALDAIAFKWPALAPVLKPRPSPLVIDGVINRKALRREFMQKDELLSELRLHGITDLAEVARAYLEPNGMVSVIRKDKGEGDEPHKPPAFG